MDTALEAILILARDLALDNLGDDDAGMRAHMLMTLIHDTYPEIADRHTSALIGLKSAQWKSARRQLDERLRLARLGLGPLVQGKE